MVRSRVQVSPGPPILDQSRECHSAETPGSADMVCNDSRRVGKGSKRAAKSRMPSWPVPGLAKRNLFDCVPTTSRGLSRRIPSDKERRMGFQKAPASRRRRGPLFVLAEAHQVPRNLCLLNQRHRREPRGARESLATTTSRLVLASASAVRECGARAHSRDGTSHTRRKNFASLAPVRTNRGRACARGKRTDSSETVHVPDLDTFEITLFRTLLRTTLYLR